jgi:CubicO group peptidase (beta-lactamase class C family)
MKSGPVLPQLLVFSILSSVMLALVGCNGPSLSPSPTQPSGLGMAVDAVVQSSIQQSGVPGITVAVAKNNTMLYVQGYGVTDVTTHQAMQPRVIFEIGSITKQFTAALIMKLQEQGKLHLSDSMASYLPEYGFPAPITIRMLLTHTSGLADFTDFPQLGPWIQNGVAEATVLIAVSQAPLQFQPGTKYSYSNSNFFALGTIIERITGQSYATNLEQQILQPLALQSTYYVLPPTSLSATGYTNNGMGLQPAVLWDRSAAFATGALSSNVYDLVTWDNALRHGMAVSPDSFKAMTTSNGFLDSGGNTYGFGLALYTFDHHPIMWHSGQIGGFYAENVVFLDSGFTVVVLTNDQDVDTDPLVFAIMNAVCGSAQLVANCEDAQP